MEKEFKDFEMETPSLTLEPDLGAVEEKEEIAEVKQPEKEPEAPALTPAEQKMVEEFAAKIDIENTNQILQYGAGTQKKMADFSDTALENVKMLLHLRDLALFVTETCGIHIMMKYICGKYNISDVHVVVQASCDSCVDHGFHMINVCKDLCAHSCIYFTDPGTYYYYFLSFQSSLIEIHGCFCCDSYMLHFLFNSGYFLFHSSDNSDTFHIKTPLLCKIFLRSYLFVSRLPKKSAVFIIANL